MIKIEQLKEILRINPDVSAEQLVKLAEYYVKLSKECEINTKNADKSVRFYKFGKIKPIDN
ncbi:MAG: hypothetical protein ACI4S3_07335 [Candidatus Gastranaerophilaceae bacterium]